MPGEIVLQPERQHDHVACRRFLPGIGQPRRVPERGRLHPELARLLRHQLGEPLLAAADVLGDGNGHVVRGLGDQRLDGVERLDLAALVHVEFGRLLPDGMGREADLGPVRHAPGFDLLEEHIERHQLHEGRREAKVIGGALVQHPARVRIYNQHGMARGGLRQDRAQRQVDRDHQRHGNSSEAAARPMPACEATHPSRPTPVRRPRRPTRPSPDEALRTVSAILWGASEASPAACRPLENKNLRHLG